MSIYFLINILTFSIPFVMSFEKKIKFYKYFPSVTFSILVVGTIFILWDYIATVRNDWSFNTQFINGIKLFSLPIEEIMFFITVPFASIFLYETAKVYLPNKALRFPKWINVLAIIFFVALSIIFRNQYYTFTVMIFTALVFLVNLINKNKLFTSKIYWIWILFTYIPFFIVNYLLTSLPIVEYSPKAIWGIRITSIPFEDFFYSFSMLSFNLFFYLLFKEKWQRKK